MPLSAGRHRAIAADEGWLRCLTANATALPGVIESSYRHGVNIRSADGELLWLAARGTDPAPNAMLTDAGVFGAVEAGRSVRMLLTDLVVADHLVVDVSGCRVFSCRVSTSRPDGARVAAGTRLAGETLAACRRAGGMIAPTPSGGGVAVFADALRRRLAEGTTRFQSAIVERDVAAAVAAASLLIGLGTGSTPAGDDYLVGALLVLSSHQATASFRCTLAYLLRPRCDRTTAVSRSYLLAALDGRFHTVLSAVVKQIFSSRPSGIRLAVERAAGLGATSGTDSLVGILDTLASVTVSGRAGDW